MLVQKRKTEFPIWGDVFGNIFNNEWVNMPLNFKDPVGNFPAVNISESDTEFKIEMAAPGKTKEDFIIDLDKNLLSISSQKEESKEDLSADKAGKENKFTRKEYSYQSFRRSFRLPEIANSENIAASYIDGILKITVPKKKSKSMKPKQ